MWALYLARYVSMANTMEGLLMEMEHYIRT